MVRAGGRLALEPRGHVRQQLAHSVLLAVVRRDVQRRQARLAAQLHKGVGRERLEAGLQDLRGESSGDGKDG